MNFDSNSRKNKKIRPNFKVKIMQRISDTDLILNPDGSIYHLNLRPEHIADTIITVGDPDRVSDVSKYFDSIEFQIKKREFVTHTGFVGKKRLSVISSGIGTDNVEILMNELDALANIDLETRMVKPTHKSLNIIRVGTSGSLQLDLPVDSFLVSEWGIGIDGLNDFYEIDENNGLEICNQLKETLQLRTQPYCASASFSLFQHFTQKLNTGYHDGLTLTCAGFYAPQARTVRYKSRIENMLPKLHGFTYSGTTRISNFEMETAGYYLFGQLLGHQMLSLSAILANRITNQFSSQPSKQVDELIRFTLEKIEEL
jgi:uridine phosphorylase